MENSLENAAADTAAAADQKLWQTLSRNQRRVLGVLIEKSKTTPDVYPMTINGIKTGCNQKSNRAPQMDLSESVVEDVLYELRHLGCVIEVHAGGRVPKYKHLAYDWFGVSKVELGVMAELLLRGEQTVGELRTRASRMEKELDCMENLHPVLEQLREKVLIVDLTPAGRGQVVTHNLYQPDELNRLQTRFQAGDVPLERRSIDHLSIDADASDGKSQSDNQSGSLLETVENLVVKVEAMERQLQDFQDELRALKELFES